MPPPGLCPWEPLDICAFVTSPPCLPVGEKGGGGLLVQSLQMKPQVIKGSFSRELFTSSGGKNFFLIYLKYLLLKIGTAVRKKRDQCFLSLGLSFFIKLIL